MKNYLAELKNEKTISGKQLLEELLPLLKDYFVGEICLDGQSIIYLMPNGTKFILTATNE